MSNTTRNQNRKARPLANSFMTVLSVLTLGFIQPLWADELKVGDPAPSFKLVNQLGNTVSLVDQKGKWVVLYFYPKNDTPGCTTEACSFRDNINRLIAQQAVVLGVSLDDEKSHAQFAKKYELPFDLLADKGGDVTKRYGALMDLKLFKFAKRHSFIINPQGKIAQIYRSVDPDKHVKQVMDDLAMLQNNQ